MNKSALLSSLLLSSILVACGGGGGGGDGNGTGGGDSYADRGPNYSSDAQGLYLGTTESGYETKTLVLENDQYWSMYGYTMNGAFNALGLVQGNGTANNGSYSSTALRSYRFTGEPKSAAVTATYQSGVNFNGSITDNGDTTTFTSATPQISEYNYNSGANLSNLIGTWSMISLNGFPVDLSIASDGSFTGTSGSCNYSGKLTPRASGKNVLDLTQTLGYQCDLSNQTVTGVAIEYLLPDGTRQLLMAGVDGGRTTASVLVGVRQ